MSDQDGGVPESRSKSAAVKLAANANVLAQVRRALPVALLAMGLIAIAVVFVYGGALAQKRRAASQELYAHTLQVVAAGRETFATIQDFELGRRGYLLSHDPADLAPLVRAEGVIDAQFASLRELIADNPAQQARVATIETQVADLRQRVRAGLAEAQAGDFGPALAAYNQQAIVRSSSTVRATMDALVAEEQRLMAERAAASRDSARQLGYFLLGLFFVGLAFIALAAWGAFIAFRSRMRSDAAEDRAAAALNLAASERRFRTITEAMPQIVWEADPEGRVTFVNQRWTDYTGSADRIANFAPWIHADDIGPTTEAWLEAVAKGVAYENEMRLRGADGGYRWFLVRAAPLRNAAGDIEAWLGTSTDIHEARLNLEARDLLSQELSHRIKNIFQVVGSLIALSARQDPDQRAFAAALRARVAALGRAHEFVRPHSPESASRGGQRTFSAFIADLLSAYSDDDGSRIRFSGDDFTFGDRHATPLALLYHELGTNAAKYGALSIAGGRIEIDCATEGDSWRIAWRERGGPPLTSEPTHEGFGSTLARLSIEGQLGGAIARSWARDGLEVVVHIPQKVMSQS